MMKARKSAELLTLGIKMGLRQDTILRAREVFLKNESLVSFLRERLHENEITSHQVKYLLISAFDLSVGDIQPFHLWKDGHMNDADFETHLRSCISEKNNV